MNFKDFKTDFNSLSEIDKNYLIKDSKHIFYKKISKVIKDSNLFTNEEGLEVNKEKIIETLGDYEIGIDQIKATIGPTVTLYEIVPEAGIRISKIKNFTKCRQLLHALFVR